MTTAPRWRDPAGEAAYEIVVRGRVGPVVRAALLPVHAATEQQTVLRARLAPDRDVTDLLACLRARGVRVASIEAID